MPAPSLYAVSGDTIIDTSTGKPISPAEFNARATDADKAKIGRDMTSRSLMTNQEGEMGSAHVDDETSAPVEPPVQTPSTAPEPPVRQPEPVAGPAEKGGIPTLESFLEEAKPLNPDYSEVELAAAYRQTYPEAATIYKAPPIEDWVAQAKAINPDYSDEELQSAYTDVYGAPSVDDNSSDVLRGAKIVAKQAPQLAYGVTAGAGAVSEHLFGKGGISSTIKQYGIEGYQRYSADIAQDAKKSDSFNYSYAKAKEGDPRALVDWLQYAVGYVGAQGLELVATNVVGSIAGGLLLKGGTEMLASQMIAKQVPIVEAAARQTGERLVAEEVAKRATALAAKQLGGNLAIGSAAFGMEGGEIFGDLVSKAKTEGRDLTGSELMKATVMTGLAGITEFVGDKVGLDLLAGKSPIAQWITAKTGLTGRLARGTATGVVTGAGEGVTEYAQTILEEWGKGNDPVGRVSPETHAQAVDAAAIGAVGGHLAGQASGFAAPPVPDKEPPAPLDPLETITPIMGAPTVDEAIVAAQRIVEAPPISTAQLDLEIERQHPVRTFDADQYTDAHLTVDQQALNHVFERLSDGGEGVTRDESGALFYHGAPVQVVAPSALPAVTAPDQGLSKEKWDALNVVAQAFGKNLIVYQSGEQIPDGMALRQDLPSTIFLSTKTTGADAFSVFAHEALHLMEGTAFHEAFRKTIYEQLTPESKALAKARHGNLTSDVLLNEVASDIAGTELHKAEVWEKVFANLRAQVGDEQAKEEVLGFVDHLKAIIARVKTLIAERPWTGVFGESRKTLAEQYVQDLTKVHDALAAAVGNALHETRAQAKTSALGNISSQTKSSAVEKGKLALSKRSTSDRTIVPPDVAQAFTAIATAQRGAPEVAMLRVQKTTGGGVMSHAVEHAGDLIHRMTERAIHGIAGRELVREKVDKLLTTLTHAYGFEKEHQENLANNARYANVDAKDLANEAAAALKTYAAEHRALPVYNLPQWLSRAIATSVGDQRIQDTVAYAKELKTLVDAKDFNAQAFQVTRDANGTLEPYLRPIPARLIGIQKTGSVKIPDFALYNIEHDIPGHPSESSLSDTTLREEGFRPVATDLISKKEATAFRKQTEKEKLEASRKPTLTEKEKLEASRKKLVVEPAEEKVTDVRFSPQGKRIGTEEPPTNAKTPSVQWDADPLRATPEQIAKDWKGTGWGPGLPAVYQAYVPREDVPKARIPEMAGVYDWSQYKKSGVYPPITIAIHANGVAQKLDDGNHRVDYWRAKGFSHFPAWVVDFRPAVKKAMASKEKTVSFSPSVWFSGLGNMLAEKMPAKASVEQVRNLLNSPGVKQDEVKWTGIHDYLDKQTGPVDKHNLLAWLGQHNVEIEEVAKTNYKGEKTRSQLPDLSLAEFNRTWNADNAHPDFPGESTWINRQFSTVRIRKTDDLEFYHVQIGEQFLSEYDNTPENEFSSSNAFDSFNAATEAAYEYLVAEPIRREAEQYADEAPQTRYEGYKEPGGEDYTELLLTWKNPQSDHTVRQLEDGSWQASSDTGSASFGTTREQALARAKTQKPKFQSAHWDEPDILAHVRFDTRTDADGKTVLFLEEVQSDWHEQGREKGYKDPFYAQTKARREELYREIDRLERQHDEGIGSQDDPEYKAMQQEYGDLVTQVRDAEKGVEPAPFSKTWPELVMKRMLRYAAEHGVDRLAWTTGAMQNARYGLSRQLDALTVNREGESGFYWISGIKNERAIVTKTHLDRAGLQDQIGRDLTDRALEKMGNDHAVRLEGLDFEMGGSGMRYFYDQMLPKFMEKYLKRFGAKVAKTQIPTAGAATLWRADGTSNAVPKTESVHAIDITPAMKDSVLKGQPLFSPSARNTETPAFKAWFGKSKVVNKDGTPKVVYHGTNKTFEKFDVDKQGTTFDYEDLPTAPAGGFWFTDRTHAADSYAKSAGKQNQRILPVYLAMQNPYVLSAQRFADEGLYDVSDPFAIQHQGYDGIIVERGQYTNYKTAKIEIDGYDYAVFEPTQIKSATGNTGAFDAKNPDVRFAPAAKPTTPKPAVPKPPAYTVSQPGRLDQIVRVMQDKTIDIKRIVEAIQTVAKVSDDLNPVLKEEMYMKRTEQRAKDFTTDELTPLVNSMRLKKVSLEQLDRYLQARHIVVDKVNAHLQKINPQLQGTPEYDRLAGMSDKEAQALLNGANRPMMEGLAKQVDAMVAKTRKLMVDYGLEKQSLIDAWKASYKAYVPLHREGFEDEGHPTGTGRSVRGSTVKGRIGSGLDVSNILANVAQARDQIITRGEKQRPVIAMAGLLMLNPNPSIATLDKPAQIQMTNPQTGLPMTVPGNLTHYTVPMVKRFDPVSGTVKTYPDPMYKGRDNVVNFRVNGEDYAIVFNERNVRAMEAAKAFKELDTAKLNGIMAVVAPFTRYLASVNTQYNPIFGVVNFVRDAQFAMLALGSTPLKGQKATILKYAVQSLKGIYQDARDIRNGLHPSSATAALWERFQHVGGPTGYRDLFFSSTERAAEIEKMLNPQAWKAVPEYLLNVLSDYNLTMENAIRLGVFKAGVEQGMSDIQAASLAKNITVNFNKKGQIGAQMGSLYAFFNANVQGTARIAETLFERRGDAFTLSAAGKKIVVGGLLVGVLQAFALAMSGFGDDEPPEYIKARNLILPAPGTQKGYVMLPLPLGFNLLPTVGRLAAEVVRAGAEGKDLHIMRRGADLFDAIYGTFSPLGGSGGPIQEMLPTVADPIAAIVSNKDWTGKSISKEDRSTLDPTPGHTRARDTATVWAKALSKGLNWATGGTDYTPGVLSPTPDAIDYLIQQVTGGVGRELSKAAQVVQSAATGEELPSYKIPLVGRFVGSATGPTAERARFYENVKAVNLAYREFEGRALDKRGDAHEFLSSHPQGRLREAAISIERTIGELQKVKHDLIEKGAPKETIRLRESQITSLMKRFNEQVAGMTPK